MRSAGCVYNDWVDRDLDQHVARTAQRPLAAGALSSQQAVWVMGGLLGLSALILLGLNRTAIVAGLAALPWVALYPWMKRWTYWPQVFLGLTFNWGVFVGYAIEAHALSWRVLPWFVFGVLWTVVYDTIYAHQDKADDHRVGIKSSALALGDQTKKFSSVIFVIMFILSFFGSFYFRLNLLVMILFTMTMLGCIEVTLWRLPLDVPSVCGVWFKRHAWWGMWMALGLMGSFEVKKYVF